MVLVSTLQDGLMMKDRHFSTSSNYENMRVAFKMKLKQGKAAAYKERHDKIWPELAQLIRNSGISSYSIFLDEETNFLFAVQEKSGTSDSQALGQNPIVQKWWAYMADIMETNADLSPVSTPLTQVFHLD